MIRHTSERYALNKIFRQMLEDALVKIAVCFLLVN